MPTELGDVFTEGFTARIFNHPVTVNPYSEESLFGCVWLDGWLSADNNISMGYAQDLALYASKKATGG